MRYEFSAIREYDVCACALQGKKWLDAIMGEVDAEEFTESDAKALFLAIQDAYNSGVEDINYMSVFARSQAILSTLGFGGRNYLQVTRSDAKEKLDAKTTIELFREQALKVRLQRLADSIHNEIRDGRSGQDVQNMAVQTLIGMDTKMKRTYITSKELALRIIEDLDKRMDKDELNKHRILTSFRAVNEATGGLRGGSLTILSAPTGGGKSAFSMNIAYQVGVQQKIPCLYINSELSVDDMSARWGAFLSKVSHVKISDGDINEKEHGQILRATNHLYIGNMDTFTMPDLRIESVLLEIRRAHAIYGIRLVIVDYIGRMDTLNANAKDWEILYSGARWLKTLAQELDIAIIMVAQLDGSGERLSRASYMQHEADTWVNIIRHYEDTDIDWLLDNIPWNCELQIRKSRSRAAHRVYPLYFHGDTLTFYDTEQEAAAVAPPIERQ